MLLSSPLKLLVATATSALLLSSASFASVPDQSPGLDRVEPARDRRERRAGTMRLAARKKKKKKASSSTTTAAPADDDSADKSTSDSTSGSGTSDQDVDKAARPHATKADDADATKKSTVKVDNDGSSKDSGPSGPLPRYFEASVGPEGFLRSLRYNQLVQGDVREYQPKLLGAAVASVVWYPGAQFSTGFITNIGLDLNIEQAFGISSRAPGSSATFPTSAHDYNGGLRLRIPMDGIEPSLTIGYGDQAFKVTGAGAPPFPNTDYKYVRAVAAVRVALPNDLSLVVGAGYRQILSEGDIKSIYFPRLTVAGIEASAALGYTINSLFEARAGADLRRYFYSMHSRNGDPFIAGGAIDQTIAFSLSLVVTLGGTDQISHAASPPADADDAKVIKRKKRPSADDDTKAAE